MQEAVWYGDVEAPGLRNDLRALPDESRAGAAGSERRLLRGCRSLGWRSGSGFRRRHHDHRPAHRGGREGGVRREGGGLVRSPELVARFHLFVHLRQEALGEAVELRLAHLVGADLHQRVVPALGPGRDGHLAEPARVGAPPGCLVRRGEACAEEGLGLCQYLVGTQGSPMEIPHGPSHAGLKRRSVRLFSTTLRLDHAIAALASTGESSTWSHGYSTPAATGMPITL